MLMKLSGLAIKIHRSTTLAMYRQYKDMSAAESDSFNVNVSHKLKSSLDNPKDDGDAAKTIMKSPKSSIVLIPPEEVWEQIQAIREKHDKGYVRWMPHVNMVYPFLADTNDGQVFRDAALDIERALAEIKPFKVRFTKESFHYFTHKKSCTLWLQPLVVGDDSAGADVDVVNVEDQPVEMTHTDEENVEVVPEEQTLDLAQTDEVAKPEKSGGQLGSDTEATAHTAGEASGSAIVGHPGMSKNQQKRAMRKEMKTKQRDEQKSKENDDIGAGHPAILRVQRTTEQVFPECDDVSRISERGFTPHLSVGQFHPKDVENFRKEFQNDWKDIEFEVVEIYLISRANFDDPFHIRRTVPFGKR